MSCPSLVSGEKSIQLVMEYMPLGSLRDYLPRHNVGLVQLLLFSLQICEVGRPPPYSQNLPPLWPGLSFRSPLLASTRNPWAGSPPSLSIQPIIHHRATPPLAQIPNPRNSHS